MTKLLFEQIDERAKELFSKQLPVEAWIAMDESVRLYWRKQALESFQKDLGAAGQTVGD